MPPTQIEAFTKAVADGDVDRISEKLCWQVACWHGPLHSAKNMTVCANTGAYASEAPSLLVTPLKAHPSKNTAWHIAAAVRRPAGVASALELLTLLGEGHAAGREPPGALVCD